MEIAKDPFPGDAPVSKQRLKKFKRGDKIKSVSYLLSKYRINKFNHSFIVGVKVSLILVNHMFLE